MKPTTEKPATVTACDCEYCVRMNWYGVKQCMPPLEAYGRQHLVYAGAHGFCLARYGSNGNGKPTWFFLGTSARTDDVTHWKFINPPVIAKPKQRRRRAKGKRK